MVEDDPDMSEVVVWALGQARYDAVRACNGRLALKAVAERMPDLILLDMMMPVMDGWQFAREFRRRHGSATPIVVVTAAEHAEHRAQEIGAQGWLSKPFDLSDMLDLVARLCPPPETATQRV